MKTLQTRVQTEKGQSSTQAADQGWQARGPSSLVAAIAASPRMVAQRQAIRTGFGAAAAPVQLLGELVQREVPEEVTAQSASTNEETSGSDEIQNQLISSIEPLASVDTVDVHTHNSSKKSAQMMPTRQDQDRISNLSKVDTVTQLITYKGIEYSQAQKNLKEFPTAAEDDLDSIDPKRDKERDLAMLKVIGNREDIVESPKELFAIIHPQGKEYQTLLNIELTTLFPDLQRITELSRGAGKLAPVMQNDTSTESHEYVITSMMEIKEKADEVSKHVQWKKFQAINSLADESIEKAVNSRGAVLEYSDNSTQPSKQQIRKKENQEKIIKKGIEKVESNSKVIAETASRVVPELRKSADEQYLRGTVGAGSAGGSKHLTIGKKTATKPLLDTNPDEAKGILWANVWSMGVNQAFIEGGTDAGHEFRLISSYPSELEDSLRSGDYVTFIQVAREGTIKADGADPWRAYYHKDNKKLTTLGEEIVHLLKNGYVME